MQSIPFRNSLSACCIARSGSFIPRRFSSSWFLKDKDTQDNNGGSWYNPNPTPKKEVASKHTYQPTSRPVRRETSTSPPRFNHSKGYYTFFRDLEKGFEHIPWPKEEETNFDPNWMDGFTVIENYISQEEHDKFLAEVMEYNRTSNKVTHFDGRLVMNEMDTDFYPLFFNRLVNDGILKGPDRLAPNIYANGDGIPAHFDNIVHVKETVCSIGLGASDVVRFVNTRTGETKELTVPPRSLYVMTKQSRYNCVHVIDPKPRKIPRISLVGCDFYRPKLVEPDLGLVDFKDFVMMGSYGVWRHLDEVRGHTNLQQKVKLLTQFAKEHFPKQLPFFEKRFEVMGEYAKEHNL